MVSNDMASNICQTLSSNASEPRFLSSVASYDVASNICKALPWGSAFITPAGGMRQGQVSIARHVVATRRAPSFRECSGVPRRGEHDLAGPVIQSIFNPHCLHYMASYDTVSNACQALSSSAW
jgi:hypothetical protein